MVFVLISLTCFDKVPGKMLAGGAPKFLIASPPVSALSPETLNPCNAVFSQRLRSLFIILT